MSRTPSKRQLQYPPVSPKSPKSPNWASPHSSSEGHSENLNGYIILVGNEELSKASNKYYDVYLQRSKTDFTIIRVMINGTTPDAAAMVEELGFQEGNMVVMTGVFVMGDIYFFNHIKGSRMEFTRPNLKFPKSPFSAFTKKLGNVQDSDEVLMHVECQVKYLGAPRNAGNTDGMLRNAVLYDDTGHVLFTAWNSSFFHMEENRKMYITNLKLKDYFGFELSSTKNTTFAFSKSAAMNPLTQEVLAPYLIRAARGASTKDVTAACVDGAEFDAFMRCPNRNCEGNVRKADNTGIIGACDTCPKRVSLKSTSSNKIELHGEVNIGDLTLNVSADNVDEIFGDGTAELYKHKGSELGDKFLRIEELTITYNTKNNNIITWTYVSRETDDQAPGGTDDQTAGETNDQAALETDDQTAGETDGQAALQTDDQAALGTNDQAAGETEQADGSTS